MKLCFIILQWVLLLFFLFFRLSLGLYEDQVGKFDWKKSFVGKVKYSVVDLIGDLGSNDGMIFVATDKNVVAALSYKTGDIIWRNVLEKGIRGEIKMLSYYRGKVFTVSGNDVAIVRGYRSQNGVVDVEYTLNYPNILYAKSSIWYMNDTNIHRALIYPKSHISVSTFNLFGGGTVTEDKSISLISINDDDKCVYSEGSIGCLNSNGKLTVILLHDSVILSKQVISDGSVQLDNLSLTAAYGNNKPSFVVIGGEEKRLTSVIKGEIRIVMEIPKNADVYLYPVSFGTDTMVLIVDSTKKTELETSGIVLETKVSKPGLTAQYAMLNYIGVVEVKSGSCVSKKSGEIRCEILISSEDDVLTLIKVPGEVQWVREEALSSIITVEMIELPMSQTEAIIQNEFDSKDSSTFSMFVRRISSQYLQLQKALLTVLGILDKSDEEESSKLVRDKFNLHKIILVVTKVGKIFTLDNVSRSILWSYLLTDVEPFTPVDEPRILLFIQRTSRHYPHPPQCSILLQNKKTKTGVLYTFNPVTGESADKEIQLNYKILQAMLLPVQDDEHLTGLMVLDESYKVHIYPDSELPVLNEKKYSLFTFVAYREIGEIVGLGFSRQEDKDDTLIPLWNVKIRSRILKIVSKNPLEKVHSQGRVLPDRSVLYKYVNPNLIAVVSEGINEDDGKPTLLLFLIDSVIGKIIYSDIHFRATKPVHLIHSENWVVLFFFHEKSRRTEVASYELFEGTTQNNPTVFSSIDSNMIQPIIDRRAYVLPVSYIEAARETITEKGITSRHVLVGLGTGFILEVPWIFLDPRRPNVITQEMREEGVIPYVPELPVATELYINYNQTLSLISGIYTVPTSLESTCLVFVYGLDLYYTRTAPSKTFDLLKDDFDYNVIILVLILLTAVTFITRHFAYQKALHQAWR